jgi:hypothetical protein
MILPTSHATFVGETTQKVSSTASHVHEAVETWDESNRQNRKIGGAS